MALMAVLAGPLIEVPTLVLGPGFDLPMAAGASLVVIAVSSGATLAARAGHGSPALNWALVGTFAVAAVTGNLTGGRLAGHTSPQRLSTAFTVLIVIFAGYTLTRSMPGVARPVTHTPRGMGCWSRDAGQAARERVPGDDHDEDHERCAQRCALVRPASRPPARTPITAATANLPASAQFGAGLP